MFLPDQDSPYGNAVAGRPRGLNLAGALGWLVRQPQYVAACYLYMLATFAGEGILMSTATLYLTQCYGEAVSLCGRWWPVATMGGALLALRPLLQIAAAPVAGYFSDRSGDRWPVVIWGVAGIVMGLGVLALAPSLTLVLAAVCLAALGGGILCTLIPALVGDLTPGTRSGLAMGGLMTVGDIGSAVAPLAAYALLTVLRLEGIYLLAALIVATGLALPWVMRKRAEHLPNQED
jgi:MFS family permease